tara:strand:+ start:197 stop:370 length:174 start_codon:yes stop_codon:yes gene_type:complete
VGRLGVALLRALQTLRDTEVQALRGALQAVFMALNGVVRMLALNTAVQRCKLQLAAI